MTWLRHWGLSSDPFRPSSAPFVPFPEHEEAIARLVHAVENGERRAELRGLPGLGKSTVFREALGRLRRPDRRIVSVRRPADGSALLRGVGRALGLGPTPGASRSESIGRLLDAASLARAQSIGLVLAVDDDGMLDSDEDRRLIDRIEAVGRQAGGRFCVLVAGVPATAREAPWSVSIRLQPLTRTMTQHYVGEKLRAGGRTLPAFSSESILRLHALSGGVPAAIDRLAGLALRAAAIEGESRVSGPMVDGVSLECVGSSDPFFIAN